MTTKKPQPKVPEAALLRAIVESADDAIISKDLDGIITSWNRGAERIFGYREEEVIGRSISILIPQERADEEPEILARVRRGERIEHCETVRRRKDGSCLDISISVSPIRDEEGKVIGASKIARDIGEQRRGQERLRGSEERYRVTLSSIGDAVISTDRQGRVIFMNPIAEQLTGWTQQEALGSPLNTVFNIINEFDRHSVENPVSKVLQEGSVVGLANHTLLVARDGTERPIDDSGAPVRESTGDLTGVVLVFRDVTQRRQAEMTARRLGAIVANSDDAIISKSLNGIIETWNEGAERILGYTASEAIGKSIMMIIPPDRQSEENQIISRIKAGERVDHFESVRMTKEGRRIDVSLTISPIKSPASGEVIGASKILRDVTEQKRSKEALKKANERLQTHAQELERTVTERTEQLSQTVGELEAFCYSLSHDMRTPLRAIQSYSQIVLSENGQKIGSPGTDFLQRVISAAQRMDHLIQDVLAFTRLSRQEINFQPVNVEQLIRDLIHERSDWQSPSANIRIESPLLQMIGHDASLTQCVTNLLDNAVKFVPRDKTPQVRIFTERKGDEVRLSVEDQGIGIEKQAQQRLFEMFHRTHTGEDYEGTGIGLAIVRKAAERMGGRVGVESEKGKGSRFWLELKGSSP